MNEDSADIADDSNEENDGEERGAFDHF
jgi:hypothetical protein